MKRAMIARPAQRRPRRPQQDRRTGSPAFGSSTRSMPRHRHRLEPRPRPRSPPPGRGWCLHDPHLHAESQRRPHRRGRRPGVGEVKRATAVRVDPGGKGVNVSRALALPATRPAPSCPAGGPEARSCRRLLGAEGTDRPGADRRRRPRQHHRRRAGRHHHQAQRARPGAHAGGARRAASGRRGRRCRPGRDWVVGGGSLPAGVVPTSTAALVAPAVRRRHSGLHSTPAGEPFALAAEAGPTTRQAQRRGARRSRRPRRSRTLGDAVDRAPPRCMAARRRRGARQPRRRRRPARRRGRAPCTARRRRCVPQHRRRRRRPARRVPRRRRQRLRRCGRARARPGLGRRGSHALPGSRTRARRRSTWHAVHRRSPIRTTRPVPLKELRV